MEVFKGNGKNNERGLCSYDMKNDDDNDLHLLLSMNDYGCLVAGVYHEDPDKLFNFEEFFTIDGTNKQVFDLFDKYFLSTTSSSSCGLATFIQKNKSPMQLTIAYNMLLIHNIILGSY